MNIEIIVACGIDNSIGKNNTLLWNIPEDLKNFKKITEGHTVVMGRKTWESLPEKVRPLPNRRNIVISRNMDYDAKGAEVMNVFDVANFAYNNPMEKIFIIGGSEIYTKFLPLASVMHMTVVYQQYPDADAFFPLFEKSEWRVTMTSIPDRHENTPLYSFNRYGRIS